jgi:hypothetical protein
MFVTYSLIIWAVMSVVHREPRNNCNVKKHYLMMERSNINIAMYKIGFLKLFEPSGILATVFSQCNNRSVYHLHYFYVYNINVKISTPRLH